MQDDKKSLETQESTDSSLEYSPTAPQDTLVQTAPPESKTAKAYSLNQMRARLTDHWSKYVPVLIVLIIALSTASVLLYRHQNTNKASLSEQNLSAAQLNNLASANDSIGSAAQVLTVQSNAIFSNQVLVRGQLQVAGQLQISELAVNKNLSIAGDASIQGSLTVQNSISVNGGGTFSGNITAPQLTTGALVLNGNLTLSHHLFVSGSIPGRTTGSATGSGGTSSVNGSDTAGTLTINTGSGVVAGCYITVAFATPFSGTPHILLTPVGASSAGLSYYVNRTSTNFSVCSTNAPQSGQTYVFDYLAID